MEEDELLDKQNIVWLLSDESKTLAQPVIDKYRGSGYLVVLFCSGKGNLQEKTISLLLHNR